MLCLSFHYVIKHNNWAHEIVVITNGNFVLFVGAYGVFEVTHDITKYCKAKLFSKVGKKTDLFVRFSTVGM